MSSASSSGPLARRKFHTLDAIRGIAALLIVVRHTDMFWAGVRFPESYLAVDIFFLMSGVVIVNAYEARLEAGLPFGAFMQIRLVRLMPLYWLGLAFGVLNLLAKAAAGGGALDHVDLAAAAALAVFLLPSLVPGFEMFSINGPSWSLFFEIVINAIYAACKKFLTLPVLALAIVGSAACLIYVAAIDVDHSLDKGFTPKNFPVGMLRVTYSFFIGVVMARLYRHWGGDRVVLSRTLSNLLFVAVLAAVIGLLTFHPGPELRGFYNVGAVLVAFPIIVGLALFAEPIAPAQRLATFFGLISYTIYITHAPLAGLLGSWVRAMDFDPSDMAPFAGWAVLAGLILASVAINRFYDEPLRTWLNRTLPNLQLRPDALDRA